MIRTAGVLAALALWCSAGCRNAYQGESGCPEGSQSCACYGNGTCDAGLSCSMEVCVPEGCTPGQELCTCVDGQCLGDLVCEADVCKMPAGESGDGTAEGSSDASSGDSTGSEQCGTLAGCYACVECALEGPCSELYGACLDDPVCADLYDCMDMCAETPDCEDSCIETYPEAVDLYGSVVDCVLCDQCEVHCNVSPETCA